MTTNANQIGKNVAQTRRNRDISQRELAAQMKDLGNKHWHQNTVSRVEKSIQKPDLQEIGHLVRILGTEVLDGTTEAETLLQLSNLYTTQTTAKALANIHRTINELQQEMARLEKLVKPTEQP